jgi:sarcosine oxidase
MTSDQPTRVSDLAPEPVPTPTDAAPQRADLIVIGAGAMGGWTAFWAQHERTTGSGSSAQDRTVMLLDAWGAGHPRATSGDETRLTYNAHGSDRLYQDFSRRSNAHWIRFSAEWRVPLFVQVGMFFFAHRDNAWERASAESLAKDGIPHQLVPAEELLERWPQLGAAGGLRFALYEPEGGILMARRACQAVTRAFQREGGTYAIAAVRPGEDRGRRLLDVVDQSGRRFAAETFVFACGPWLPRLFPHELGSFIRVTKQDVVYIGPPEGDRRFHADAVPGWVDQDAYYYGVPAIDNRGIKVGINRFGPIFDPSNGERVVDPDSIHLVRRYLRDRFPDLDGRPVVETRVCQYETTSDEAFLIDRHPSYDNVWLVGGGSGRGFKHGPHIGEYVVARLNGVVEGAQHGQAELRFRLRPRGKRLDIDTGLGDGISATWSAF